MIEIPLTQGQVALIDDEDFELVSKHKWSARWNRTSHNFYGICSMRLSCGKRSQLLMHRLIIGAPEGISVDHINRNSTDNRRCNLRLCTNSENMHNRGPQTNNVSGFKGVSWNKRDRKWQSHICLRGKRMHLGYFSSPEDAFAAYCSAATRFHGKFACLV